MKKVISSGLVILLLNATLVAAPLAVVHDPGSQKILSNLILRPKKQTGETLFGVADPEKSNLLIKPADINFEDEQESFAQFRGHYAAYWMLFMAMLITDAAWED